VGYNPNGWVTHYDVDFASLSNLNIKTGGNGNKTIDGKVWLWGNDASATAANVTNGSGIVVNPVANSGSASPSARAGSILTIPITNLLPLSLNMARHAIRIMAQVSLAGATVASQGVRLGIEYGATPKDAAISVFKGYTTVAGTGLQFLMQSSTPPATPSANFGDASNTGDDVLLVDFEWPDLWEARTGLYSGGLPYTFPNFRYAEALNSGNPSPLIRLQADPLLVLSWQDSAAAGGGGFTGTVKRLRVEQFNKWPT
jgi:hypothetical protein